MSVEKKMVVVLTCMLLALVLASNAAFSDMFHGNTEQSSIFVAEAKGTTNVHVQSNANTNTYYNSHKHLMLSRKLHDSTKCGGQEECINDDKCKVYGDNCVCRDIGEGKKCYLDLPCNVDKTCNSDDICITDLNPSCKCNVKGTGKCYDAAPEQQEQEQEQEQEEEEVEED